MEIFCRNSQATCSPERVGSKVKRQSQIRCNNGLKASWGLWQCLVNQLVEVQELNIHKYWGLFNWIDLFFYKQLGLMWFGVDRVGDSWSRFFFHGGVECFTKMWLGCVRSWWGENDNQDDTWYSIHHTVMDWMDWLERIYDSPNIHLLKSRK